ncbi:hypothetical protein K438DRAFT_1146893 [Mycena galopus ATCC 62051]|nr:hypothetical protein K438DRAFT_1146893 [Mycena galopus ATCC 62051]
MRCPTSSKDLVRRRRFLRSTPLSSLRTAPSCPYPHGHGRGNAPCPPVRAPFPTRVRHSPLTHMHARYRRRRRRAPTLNAVFPLLAFLPVGQRSSIHRGSDACLPALPSHPRCAPCLCLFPYRNAAGARVAREEALPGHDGAQRVRSPALGCARSSVLGAMNVVAQ